MKKLFLIPLMIALVGSLVFGACAAPEEAPPAPPAPVGMIDCIIAHGYTPFPEDNEAGPSNTYVTALLGAAQYYPALKGVLNVMVYDSASLYTRTEALPAIASGSIQMTYTQPSVLEQFAPEWKLMSIPGILSSFEHFRRVMKTDVWKASAERLDRESGIHMLNWGGWNVGDQYLWTSKGPVETLEDWEGQAIRHCGGEATAKVLEAWGLEPVFLDFTEVVTALQTGMIDGVVTDHGGGVYYGLKDYCPYLYLMPVVLIPQGFCVNSEWWWSLPEDVRDSIEIVFDKIDTEPWVEGKLNALLEEWNVTPGCHTTELDEAEMQKWLDAASPTIKGLTADIAPKYLEAIEAVR